MIDSTFYGVCAYRRLRIDQYRRQNLHLLSDLPRYYHLLIRRHLIIQQHYRHRVKHVHPPLYRPRSIFYISRHPRAKRRKKGHPHRVHLATNLVNHHQARQTSVTFAVPTDTRGLKFARRYEPLKANKKLCVCPESMCVDFNDCINASLQNSRREKPNKKKLILTQHYLILHYCKTLPLSCIIPYLYPSTILYLFPIQLIPTTRDLYFRYFKCFFFSMNKKNDPSA